jgi:2-polyprenyl-6-methoxyphenol hydroxylase-like FAD-dependent oxidoreductase
MDAKILYLKTDKHLLLLAICIDTTSLGYYYTVFPRPALYALMLAKIPQEKLLFNKKVVSMDQSNDSVSVQCADGTTYSGDILVGADGAYSGVRQSLYEQLSKQGQLPASDTEQMCYNYMTMVGTTGTLDPAVFSKLGGDSTTFSFMLGTNSPYSVCHFFLFFRDTINNVACS